MSFQILREKLSQKPSRKLFSNICEVFESWDDGDVEQGIAYAQEHFEPWDDSFRHADGVVWSRKLPVWWPLVRSYRHSGNKKLPTKWAKKPELLKHITQLELAYNDKVKSADEIRSFVNLESLILYQCNVLEHADGFELFPRLTKLELSHCRRLKNVRGLANLCHIEYLWIDCEQIDVEPKHTVLRTTEEVEKYQKKITRYYKNK